MELTLRLSSEDAEALRQCALREGRSIEEVAQTAVRVYLDRGSRRELLDEVLDAELPGFSDALSRLGEP
jgi:hypothetical protein